MSTDAIATLTFLATVSGVLLLRWFVRWLLETETAPVYTPTRPRVYGRCQRPGCQVKGDPLRLVWSHDAGRREGEAIDDRRYLLCRHHREQAQAKIDDLIEDWVSV